jgi:transposase
MLSHIRELLRKPRAARPRTLLPASVVCASTFRQKCRFDVSTASSDAYVRARQWKLLCTRRRRGPLVEVEQVMAALRDEGRGGRVPFSARGVSEAGATDIRVVRNVWRERRGDPTLRDAVKLWWVSPMAMDENADPGADIRSAPMSSHTSARSQRIEVITRGEVRRRWSVEQKREIAAESLEPGASASAVARRHSIGTGQLSIWRRQLREGQLGERSQLPAKFARVAVLSGPAQPGSAMAGMRHEAESTSAGTAVTRSRGTIEIVLPGGVSVRVDGQVDSGALRRVLAALTMR